MGMDWHELRELGHDRLRAAIAEAQQEDVADRGEHVQRGLDGHPGSAGQGAALRLRAGLGTLLAAGRRLAWRPRIAATP